MNPAHDFGRKESAYWPSTKPVHAFGGIVAALVTTGLLCWLTITFTFSPLQRYYARYYFRSGLPSIRGQGSYRLLMVGGPAQQTRTATPADLADDGGLRISNYGHEHGYTFLALPAAGRYRNADLHGWLWTEVYYGHTLTSLLRFPLLAGFGFLLFFGSLGISKDIAARKLRKYGRVLRGLIMVTPTKFARIIRGDGIGFKVDGLNQPMRIPRTEEARHFQIVGDSGSGKTALIMQILAQVAARGHSAIVYDPAGEYMRAFYDPHRGDVVLNPLDARCPYWSPSEEIRDRAEAKALAMSLFQPPKDKTAHAFFTEAPQRLLSLLISQPGRPTPAQLVNWMSNPREIDQRVRNTPEAVLIEPGAGAQRAGVLASLNMIADSFRELPEPDQCTSHWTATEWAENPKGWVFITSRPSYRAILMPLISLWIDILVMRLLNEPERGGHRNPVWFVIDELASLQRLPQLQTALKENRKSGNPIVLGFQGKADLEDLYGHPSQTMTSQPSTSIFLKTSEPLAAKWISEAIGDQELETFKESRGKRGNSITPDIQSKPLVMPSQIMGLPALHGFMKLANLIVPISFPYPPLPVAEHGTPFIKRPMRNDPLLRSDPPAVAATPDLDEQAERAARAQVSLQFMDHN